MYYRLNAFRFFLALCVVAFHLKRDVFVQSGSIAVWLFFMVSGFLVTKILCETYSGRPRDFIVNRFLRLYPAYWAVMLIGIALIIISNNEIHAYHDAITWPKSLDQWLSNLLIFNNLGSVRFIPPSWSLAIELKWYVILFVIHFLSLRVVTAFLACQLLLPFLLIFVTQQDIYVKGAGFAFALGSLSHHYKCRMGPTGSLLAFVALLAFMLVVPPMMGFRGHSVTPRYGQLNFLFCCVLLYFSMPFLTGQSIKQRRWAQLLGDLSYPLFLVHWYCGFLAIYVFGFAVYSWPYLLTATLLAILLSLAIVFGVERPVGYFRQRIRQRQGAREQGVSPDQATPGSGERVAQVARLIG